MLSGYLHFTGALDSSANLKVVFSDLRPKPDEAVPRVYCAWNFTEWQREATNAAMDCLFLLTREVIDICQRNSNASFSLLRKVTEAKGPASVVELQVAHLNNQLAALARQREELAALSATVAMAFLRQTYLAGWHLR